MEYTREQAEDYRLSCGRACMDLLRLQLKVSHQASGLDDAGAKEHLLYGVGRRLDLIRNAIGNIYRIFPPDRAATLTRQEAADVQINLHAFVINLAGCFDSMAWAFVARHGLLGDIPRGERGVALFYESTARFLPQRIRDYLSADAVRDWNTRYLKHYRDSLAHRIPLYMPRAVLTDEQATEYSTLEVDKMRAIERGDVGLYELLETQQARIGRPCFSIMHSPTALGQSRPIAVHPQLVSDVMALIDLGHVFLDNWHERAAA